jgi:excisionase family DNA binding protein
MDDSPQLSHLTVPEAARRLGVSERTVWRYLRAGRLDGHTTGPAGAQRTLIDAGGVAGMLAARGRDPEADAVRAERDRLTAELAATRAELDLVARRLAVARRALARPRRPAPLDRVADTAARLLERVAAGRGRPVPGR